MPDFDSAQRAVLGAHPRMVGIDDLVTQLDGSPRVREALAVLVDDGLATQLGDRVGLR